jgi:hypothetical protein
MGYRILEGFTMGAVLIVWLLTSFASSLVLGRAFWIFDGAVVATT